MEAPEVLWLSGEQVSSLGLSMKEIIDAIDKGFKLKAEGKAELPSKIGVHPRPNCFIHAMPCWLGGDVDTVGIKWNAGYPTNKKLGLPYMNGTFCINDCETGLLISVMNSNSITAWRTGAASGVCVKYMANSSVEILAIVGLGVEGISNLLAVKEVLPKIKLVKIYDTSLDQVKKYQEFLSPQLPGVSFLPCKNPETTVRDADIVITCTPILDQPKRFIRSSWLKSDVLAIAIDYDSSFDADVMTDGIFVCDDKNTYLMTQKESRYFHDGYPVEMQIYADMGEIVIGTKKPVKRGLRGVVLMGLASHDIITGRLIYEKAIKKGVGTWLQR